MISRWRSSIGTRFTLITLFVVLGLGLLFAGFEVSHAFRQEVDRLTQYIFQVHQSHIPALVHNLWLTDENTLQLQLEAIVRFPYLERAEVTDETGVTFAAGRAEIEGLEQYREPLFYSRRGRQIEIGELVLFIDQKGLRSAVLRDELTALAGHLLTAFATAIAIYLLFRNQIGLHLCTATGEMTKSHR